MPSITTHHFFSKELLNHLTEDELKRFNKELTIYHTFAQSHDYLFYYTFNLKHFKEIKALGHYAHHHNTQDYIINIIKEIKDKKLEDNHQLIAYLYGSITHYCLDSICHPFIFYKTGVYRKNNKKYYKYRGEHNKIEKHLDAIYYEKYSNKKYNLCNINKEIIKKPIFNNELKNCIKEVYKKTYNKNNIDYFYTKGIKHAKIFNTLIVNDRFGIKKFIYKIIDFLTNHHWGYLSVYSTYIKKPNLNYLNLEHKEWNHPSIKELKYTHSFEDLYNNSLEKSLKIIREVNKVLYENKKIEDLLKVILNVDYATGLLINDTRKMDYFEY